MNFALCRFILRRHRVGLTLAWLIPSVIGSISGLVYPEYAKNKAALLPLVQRFARLLNSSEGDMLAPGGYFSMTFQHPITLIAFALAVAMPVLALPAGERGRGALDMLLATPLSRRGLIRSLVGALVPVTFLFAWAPFVGVFLGALAGGVSSQVPLETFVHVALNAWAFLLALMGVALVASATAADLGSSMLRFGVVFVASFILDVGSRLVDSLAWLRWISLLGYYRPAQIVAGHADDARAFGVLLGVALVGWWTSERIADRRFRA